MVGHRFIVPATSLVLFAFLIDKVVLRAGDAEGISSVFDRQGFYERRQDRARFLLYILGIGLKV